MENPKNQERKEKRRVLPLFWWFGGALLTGGLLVFAWLYHKGNGEIRFLEKTLEDTRTAWEGEKQTLLQKLSEVSDRFEVLKTDLASANDNLAKEAARNRRLSAQNANLNQEKEQARSAYATLLEQMNTVSAENENHKSEKETLRTRIDQLTTQLKDKDALGEKQSELIAEQKSRIASDSAASAAFSDSMGRVHTRKFFNATDLIGGYGLNYRDVPYSQYFYGLTTVNGLMIDNHFMAGIGIGLINFDAGLVAPVFMEFRYSFGNSGFNPYIYTDGGFELKFDDFNNSNLFIHPGVGLTKKLNEKIALDLGLGYYQHREAIRSSFISFKLGLVFLGDGVKPAR